MSKINNEMQNSHSWIMLSSIMKSRILVAPILRDEVTFFDLSFYRSIFDTIDSTYFWKVWFPRIERFKTKVTDARDQPAERRDRPADRRDLRVSNAHAKTQPFFRENEGRQ